MIYSRDLGKIASVNNSGIKQGVTNPSPIGYSVNKPLARVKKQSLAGSLNINAINFPAANYTTTPLNSLGTVSDFVNDASTFANNLGTEVSTFATGTAVGTTPNYYWIIGGVVLLLVFKSGGSYSSGTKKRK